MIALNNFLSVDENFHLKETVIMYRKSRTIVRDDKDQTIKTFDDLFNAMRPIVLHPAYKKFPRCYVFMNWPTAKFLIFAAVIRYEGIKDFSLYYDRSYYTGTRDNAIQFNDDGTEAMFLFHHHDRLEVSSNTVLTA